MPENTHPTRRQVLAGGAVAGAGLLFGAGAFSPGRARAASLPVAGTYDVVVVGAGAAGMTAALTAVKLGLSVVVLEKASVFGGSLARSGSGVWIPNNSVVLAAGVPDTPALAAEYLAAVANGGSTAAKQAAFLANGPTMLDFVMANSPLKYQWMNGYSDYYCLLPGAMKNGRSVEPSMLDGHVLGSQLASLRAPYMAVPSGLVVYDADYKWIQIAAVNAHGAAVEAECLAAGTEAALLGQAPLTMGQASAAGLRAGLLSANVPVWLSTPMESLVTASGAVTGVVATVNGVSSTVTANRGVIIAAGGFEHNLAMRTQYLPAGTASTSWTLGADTNTGDGIQAGLAVGAAVGLMDQAWWGPVLATPGSPYFCLAERTEPGGLIVNQAGHRFVDEAAPYGDVVKAMYTQNPTAPDIPCWLIVDQNYRDRYLFDETLPLLPLPSSWYSAGTVYESFTITGLANAIGVPAANLQATIARFNGFAATGADSDFSRGVNYYDHYYTDPAITPNSCLAPLTLPPYYAFQMQPGDLGTKGGLVTDASSRVLDGSGNVIPGLYAAGNSSAAVMGYSYAGAGATIGPAMTFGYIAAHTIAAS
jgi:3-oxosteroid 1-dehydrogenase